MASISLPSSSAFPSFPSFPSYANPMAIAQAVRSSLPDPATYPDESFRVAVSLPSGGNGVVEFWRLQTVYYPHGRRGKWCWIPIDVPDELLMADH